MDIVRNEWRVVRTSLKFCRVQRYLVVFFELHACHYPHPEVILKVDERMMMVIPLEMPVCRKKKQKDMTDVPQILSCRVLCKDLDW